MPKHDIIDNRTQKLVDHIRTILDSTEMARFAVGYFFLSGLAGVSDKLDKLKEVRLLIGNTSNQRTIEQLAEGYRRLDLLADSIEAQRFPKRNESKQMAAETADNMRSTLEVMDQTDNDEMLVKAVIRMIEEKRLKVRVYTKGRLHAKAYIFDYHTKGHYEPGVAIVGSSNLSLGGVSNNTELNVVVHGKDNHTELVRWFDELWSEALDFDESLMNELKQSWAAQLVRPYDIYMKTLYALVRDRLEDDDSGDLPPDDLIFQQLADFQENAVSHAVKLIRDYGGAFVSDVVGLGKSYIGAAVVKYFERVNHARPLIICPRPLVEMWERYNEAYHLNARVLSMSMLRENEADEEFNLLLEDVKYRDRDFVLIDESHNFRNMGSQRYAVLQKFMGTGRRCCFLTATPRNSSAWDVYHQLKLFLLDDKTDLPISPPNLKDYFRKVETGEKKLQDLLVHILIRRTRKHILRFYGLDAQTNQPVDSKHFDEYLVGKRQAYVMVAGKQQFFPKRTLATIEYSIEATYQGLYQRLRGYLGRPKTAMGKNPPKDELCYARYGLWNYVLPEKRDTEPYVSLQRAGRTLRGLMRILLFKRFESSVHAFRQTVKKLLVVHERFMMALEKGFVPAGEEAQAILYDPSFAEEQNLIDALRAASKKYPACDFDTERLFEHIQHDVEIFQDILKLVEPITPSKDAKLQTLIAELQNKPLKTGKRLIFTQYADTAQYLFENLNPGGKRDDIDVVCSGDKNKGKAVGRFSPKSNSEYKFAKGEWEITTLIATDVLAEGLNLQDCDKIINYDLHWNPVRLIQRFGRIDRIGTEHGQIYGFNFLPEIELERNLSLLDKLRNRIKEIQETIGEDSAILDPAEQLNHDAMYAIYDKNGQLGLFDKEEEDYIDLNEAEEILRQLQRDNPQEFQRIADLRDGIRSAMASPEKGSYVFCQAEREGDQGRGRYQQLFLVDKGGAVVSRDIPRVLNGIRCGPELEPEKLPATHNGTVMKIKSLFVEEVKHRQSEREHSLGLSHGQKFVLRELRILFAAVTDEEIKGQINILEKAFRGPITTSINRELNVLRKGGIVGDMLFKKLKKIYNEHQMRNLLDRVDMNAPQATVTKIICSEAML